MATEAKLTKLPNGAEVWEHKHGKFGYHWASAKHPKDTEAHEREDAANPTSFGVVDGKPIKVTQAMQKNYAQFLNRDATVLTHIRDTHPHLARYAGKASKDGAGQDEEDEVDAKDFALESAAS